MPHKCLSKLNQNRFPQIIKKTCDIKIPYYISSCIIYSADIDVDAMDDVNVREYLESRIVSDPDNNDDDLSMPSPSPVPAEPVTDLQTENNDQTENIQVTLFRTKSRHLI